MNYFEDEDFCADNLNEIDSFSGSEFICCEFKNLDLSEKDFRSSKFLECKFVNCNLSNVILLGTTFRDVSFSNSKCIGVNFGDCNTLFDLNFKNCLVEYASFESVNLNKSSFIDTSFKNSTFTAATLAQCDFSGSNFQNAILDGANLKGSNLKGATNYYIDMTKTNVNGCKFSIPEALDLLTPFGVIIE